MSEYLALGNINTETAHTFFFFLLGFLIFVPEMGDHSTFILNLKVSPFYNVK